MLLSVIVPIYNTEKYLQQCIESILCQKVSDMELILVDDGSTDRSGEICDIYAQTNALVKVIHKEWSGVQDARLMGVQNARGTYVTFVDSDDWICNNAYQELLFLLNEHKAELAVSGITVYHNVNNFFEDHMVLEEGYYDRKAIEEKIIPCMLWGKRKDNWELDPSLCTKIFKRELLLEYLKKTNDLNIHYAEDPAVVYPMMLDVNSIIVKNKSYYYYRQREKKNIPSYISDSNYFDKLYKVYDYFKKCFYQSKHWDVLQEQLERFYIKSVQLKMWCYGAREIESKNIHIFPYERILKNNKVILYGAGNIGKKLKNQNEIYNFCNIVAWIDKKYKNFPEEMKIMSPEKIQEIEFDYIIVAIADINLAKEIIYNLIETFGVQKEKIIWERANVERISL